MPNNLRRGVARFRDVFEALPEPLFVEIGSALLALSWAGWLMMNDADLATFQNYSVLSLHLTTKTCLCLSATVGTMQLAGVILDYSWRDQVCWTRWTRWSAAFLIAWWWAVLADALYLARPASPGFFAYTIPMGQNILAMILLCRPPCRVRSYR